MSLAHWLLHVCCVVFCHGGYIYVTGDSDWVSKYLTYNQAVAQVPGIIVFVGNVDHIREALKFAYKYRIEVRLQSTGMCAPYSSCIFYICVI